MTYFNPRIYNYSNLREEDKLFVNHTAVILNEVENMIIEYTADDEALLMEQMYYENGQTALKEAVERIQQLLVDYMVTTIDNYKDDVEEIDTNNHFYGSNIK